MFNELMYDFRPTGNPLIDALDGLIEIAEQHRKNGDVEKAKEIAAYVKEKVDNLYKKVNNTEL